MRACVALLSAIAAAVVFAPVASAVPLVVTDGSALVNVDTNSLPTPSAPIPVTGMQPAETLVGIDQRPATGQLYGIGSTSRLYILDAATGAATQIGAAGAFTLSGNDFGTDFNPVPDRLRVVSDDEQNLRLNPNDGTAVVDSLLNPAGNVVAAAYNNNRVGATTTTLFEIDSASGKLVRQGGFNGAAPSPNGGNLSDVGSLGLGAGLNTSIGFDIGADTSAFATITVGGFSKLWGINTNTGLATDLGTIGTGATPYRGLAIMPARVRLTSDTLSASEGGTATFQVIRNAPAAGPVTVDYSTAAGTATAGDDFTPASGTLTWAAGESGVKTIAVPVAADTPAEGDETFSVSLSNVAGADAVAGTPTTAVATIAANEAGPALQFDGAAAAAAEGGSATLTVARVGSVTQPVSVDYATAPGSASAGDYTPAAGTVSWAAGDGAPKTISIPITDDPAEEGAESFGVTLANPTGGATLGNPAAATVTIAASDPPAPAPPVTKAKLKFGGATRQKLSTVKRKGVAIESTVDKACSVDASVLKGKKRVGRLKRSLKTGKKRLRIPITKKYVKGLRARQKLTVSATCSNTAGKSKTAKRTVKLTTG
jgi:hypothetical protein